MSSPHFWATPIKYCAWAARERPAIFWSVVIGATGPAMIPIVPPIRHALGDIDPAPIPVTYPGLLESYANINGSPGRTEEAIDRLRRRVERL